MDREQISNLIQRSESSGLGLLSPDDCVNNLDVDANARPQGHRHLLARPRAFSVVQKTWSWAYISVQKPRGARGGW